MVSVVIDNEPQESTRGVIFLPTNDLELPITQTVTLANAIRQQ